MVAVYERKGELKIIWMQQQLEEYDYMTNNISTIDQPLVSIVIPAFNRATLIGETLDSVLAQTYSNWECVVVDDGSTDNTIEVINSYSEKDNRFRIFERDRKPKGAPTCRNIGLEKSRGEFVVFLDSDDILFPDALEIRANFLITNINLDFCVSDGLRGEYPINSNNEYKLISTYRSEDVLKEFFSFTPPWVCLNPTYRRESLINNHVYWDENMKGFQDIDFHVQTIVKKLKFEYLNDRPDCLWTSHDDGNIGRDMSNNGVFYEQKLYILDKYKDCSNHKLAITNLTNNILRSYYDISIPSKSIKPTVNIIRNSSVTINSFSLILLELYRYSFHKRIPIMPRVIKWSMIISGNKKFLQRRTNEHFLIKPYFLNK